MLDSNAMAAASKTLHDHWRAGTKFCGLDDTLRPRDRIEAYAIQAEIEKYSSKSLFGWKIAATRGRTKAHQRRRPDGWTYPGRDRDIRWRNGFDGGQRMRVVEPEFAFRMRVDLPERTTPYTMQQVLDAADTLHPAVEIPDSRFCRLRQRRGRADHCRQRLHASVRPRPGGKRKLADAGPGRGAARHHDARPAIHRSRQECAGRSADRTDLARQ
jgi:hypothetical protein